MCGIAGIVSRRPINADAVSGMIAQMAHRGPDGDGVWFNADHTVGFGHRRLAVIDPTAAGAQPMTDPTGSTVITFKRKICSRLQKC